MLETCQSFSPWSFSACDQLGVGVAEAGGGDAGQAVEIVLALGRVEARALAALERQRGAVVDAHEVIEAGLIMLRHGAHSQKRISPPRGRDGD